MAVEPETPPTRSVYVKVGRRDNLSILAQRHRVSVAQLKSWNNLRSDTLMLGQSLQLQVPNRTGTIKRVESKNQRESAPARHNARHIKPLITSSRNVNRKPA